MFRSPLAYVALAVVLALMAHPGAARADVDLTGTWVVESDTGDLAGVITETVTLTQSGTVLAFDDMNGTIDPATGVFHVEGPPTPPPMYFPPGPPPTRDGTATADGGRISGTWTAWAHTLNNWVPFTFPMRATRQELIICGDDIRDPGEPCDLGALNSAQCCDACTLVDPDADGLCSALDDCPDDANPDQIDVCGGIEAFAATRIRLSGVNRGVGKGKVAVSATLSGLGATTIDAVPLLDVHDASGFDLVVSDLGCTRKKGVLKCKTPDRHGTLKIATTSKGTKLTAKFSRLGIPPLVAPLVVSFTDQASLRRAAAAPTCATQGSTVTCTP